MALPTIIPVNSRGDCLIKKQTMMAALFAIFHLENRQFGQGTSLNKSWHSFLRIKIPMKGGVFCFDCLEKFFKIPQIDFNRSIENNRILRERVQKGAAIIAHMVCNIQFGMHSVCVKGSCKKWSKKMGEGLRYKNLLRMEFVAKHRVADESGISEVHWIDTEEANLCDFLRRFPESREIHTVDLYYYISHHVLNRSKTVDDVKRKIRELKTRFLGAHD